MPSPDQIMDWQRRYDAGETVAAIAADAGVDRTTVNKSIAVVSRTGPRASVSPTDAVAAMVAAETVAGAAKRLGATVMQVRHALWRAGVANDPLRRGRGDWDWQAGRGLRWDIADRLRVRDRFIAEARASGVTDVEIAERRGMDAAIVTAVRRKRARKGA